MTPALYWRLFRLSPLIMLVGMASGGLLFIRSVLVWGIDQSPYGFGIDIPIAAVVFAGWGCCVAALLHPPRPVLARRDGRNEPRVLVWPLGRRFRFWMLIAAPMGGVAAAFAPFAVPIALSPDPENRANPWFALPAAIVATVVCAAMIWMVLRGALYGVELTRTHLIARGYFVTRTYSRDTLVSINAVTITQLPALVLSGLMNRDVGHALQLSLLSGDEPVLYAANSHLHDVELGAEMVRAWRERAE